MLIDVTASVLQGGELNNWDSEPASNDTALGSQGGVKVAFIALSSIRRSNLRRDNGSRKSFSLFIER
jgi:hypothetical protein